MAHNTDSWYQADARAAEYYDCIETGADDIQFIRKRIEGLGPLRILEPFCGTGRILIPLAVDGHELVGMDMAQHMLDRARSKIAQLPGAVHQRVTLIRADVTSCKWPTGFDVVLMGGNWPYELPTAEVQEGCIESAAAALKPGGYVFHDSDHMEGELAESWQTPGVKVGQPWTSADGVRFEPTSETIWYDAPRRLWRARRSTTVTFPDGKSVRKEYIQQKHPPSRDEIRGWLEKHGFIVEHANETPGRITYWARKG